MVETWNSANGFIFFGKGGEVASNRLDDQEVSVHALHLLQSCLVYVNTLMLQRVLAEPAWMARMTPADVRGLTPAGLGPRQPLRHLRPRHGAAARPRSEGGGMIGLATLYRRRLLSKASS